MEILCAYVVGLFLDFEELVGLKGLPEDLGHRGDEGALSGRAVGAIVPLLACCIYVISVVGKHAYGALVIIVLK